MQDAFAALHRHWSGLAHEGAALGYLRIAVANGARSQLRRRRTVRAFRAPRPVDVPSAESVVVRQENEQRLWDALVHLPLRQREVVLLRYFFDLSEAQIADELAISRGSVKQHASRAMAALGSRLEVAR